VQVHMLEAHISLYVLEAHMQTSRARGTNASISCLRHLDIQASCERTGMSYISRIDAIFHLYEIVPKHDIHTVQYIQYAVIYIVRII
jgi:hypothetical protein